MVLRIAGNVHSDSATAFAGTRLHFLDGERFRVDVVDEIEKNGKIEHVANRGNVVQIEDEARIHDVVCSCFHVMNARLAAG